MTASPASPSTTSRAKWRSGLVTGVLVLLALSLGMFVDQRLPDPASVREAPFIREVSRNASVNLRTGQVNVVNLNASPTLRGQQVVAVSKEGTFLVLDLEFRARNQPGTLSHLTLQATDGRTFGGLPPTGSDGCGPAQPGIAVRCQVVFEVDRPALAGLKLRVPSDNVSSGQGDVVALIDLSIDPAQAQRLNAQKAPLDVSSVAQVQERP